MCRSGPCQCENCCPHQRTLPRKAHIAAWLSSPPLSSGCASSRQPASGSGSNSGRPAIRAPSAVPAPHSAAGCAGAASSQCVTALSHDSTIGKGSATTRDQQQQMTSVVARLCLQTQCRSNKMSCESAAAALPRSKVSALPACGGSVTKPCLRPTCSSESRYRMHEKAVSDVHDDGCEHKTRGFSFRLSSASHLVCGCFQCRTCQASVSVKTCFGARLVS